MLADTRVAHLSLPEGLASRGSLQEMSRESSVPMELVQIAPTDTLADSSAVTQDRQAVDVHLSFLRYGRRPPLPALPCIFVW